MKEQVVKNKSKAYGYSYASLADIAKQGFTIPKMKTGKVEGELFMFWYDVDLNDWIQGAPVVVTEMRGMNAAQATLSAITYARRGTVQMALGLACDDDARLEASAPQGRGEPKPDSARKIDFRQVREHLSEIHDVAALMIYWKNLGLSEKQAAILKDDFTKRKEELGGENGVE